MAPLFVTSALDGLEWSASLLGGFTPGGKNPPPPVPIESEAAWAPEPVWKLWRTEKSCSCQDSNPGRSAHCPSLYGLSYPDSSHQTISFQILSNLAFVYQHPIHIYLVVLNQTFKTGGTYN
jgi:hypothetical protein